jgi:hypothetical protein
MKNKKQPLSHVQEKALTLLKQDWHLLVRSTRSARTNECSQLGISNRAIASALNVDEGTVRQDLSVHRLSDTEKLEIDRGAAVAPILMAARTEKLRVAMITRTGERTTGWHRSGLLQLLRSFVTQIPGYCLLRVIEETRTQVALRFSNQSKRLPFPSLTPEGVIARAQPEQEEEAIYSVVNFWSEWIANWTLALVPDYHFVDDTLVELRQEILNPGLAA